VSQKQSRACVLPASEVAFAGHSQHSTWPGPEKKPALHMTHCPVPFRPIVPAKPALHVQLVRMLLEGKLDEFPGHNAQDVEPSLSEYIADGHAWQLPLIPVKFVVTLTMKS
jgi:hypothetical protein